MNVPAISANIKLATPTIPNKPDEATLRAALSKDIVERDHASGRRDRAQAAVDRSRAFVDELQAKVDELISQDRDVTASTAAAFKAALAKDVTPKLTPSDELSTTAVQRMCAEGHLLAGCEALRALEGDLKSAEEKLQAANAKVRQSAKAVVATYASRLAEELLHAETTAALLRRRLLGVTQMRAPHIGAYPVDAFTMSVCRGDSVPHYSHSEPSDVRHFDELLERLMSNADAQPERAQAR